MKHFSVAFLIVLQPVVGLTDTTSYTHYGTVGLIDMPTAESDGDGRVIVSHSIFDGDQRTTLTAQLLPRLSGSFRYSGHGKNGDEALGHSNWDRSFDLRIRLFDEGRYLPALAIGLNDFIGTGWYSSEYIVGTKSIGPFKFSGGLGFGRLASYGGFDNPLGALSNRFKTRQNRDYGAGGEIEPAEWFNGDAAFFGGAAWHIGKGVTAKVEYSSDQYAREASYLNHKTPWNYGVSWEAGNGFFLQSSWLHGDTLALSTHVVMDPKDPPNGPGREPAPAPVRPRGIEGTKTWQNTTNQGLLEAVLKADGLVLKGFKLEADHARLQLVNTRYRSVAQALGRAARTASRFLDDSVLQISIEFLEADLVTFSAKIARSELEAYAVSAQPTVNMLNTVTFSDSQERLYGARSRSPVIWSLGPYVEYSLFDPKSPIRGDVGVELKGQYRLGLGFFIDGKIRKSVFGNFDEVLRFSDSVLPHVRSDHAIYARDGDPGLEQFTITKLDKFSPNTFGRLSAGYLEKMFAGVSGEILWKPTTSRLGLGIELSQVYQRDFDMQWGLQDYKVTTGHLSAYYSFDRGFSARLDAGQYLAGDRGYSLRLAREFPNGWRLGGFATITNVPFEKFGEGSFDKGIFLRIPLDWSIGTPTKRAASAQISPITRDGGAKLWSPSLYEALRYNDRSAIYREAGRFWK
ncbi:YjbH domain-containing protein [Paracoccaceae bacterium]|nr:YjbH domain-containing protein [Paracoccaceae bacterium]